MEKLNNPVKYLLVDKHGKVADKLLEVAITDKDKIISIMMANNEIGTIQDIRSLSEIAKEIELYAEAAYDWKHGSRKMAYKKCSGSIQFSICITEDDYIMEKRIVELVDQLTWRKMIIDILINSPDINIETAVWVKKFMKKSNYC